MPFAFSNWKQNTTSLNNGLISYWKMDGNSIDSKGTNNGSDSNMTYSYTNSKLNQNAVFNGTNSKINIPSSSSLNSPSSALTYSIWINSNITTSQIVAIKYIVGASGDYFFSINSGAWRAASAGGTGTIVNPTSFTTGIWYHLCLTWSSGILLTFYINGVLVGTDNTPGNISSTNFSMDIGSYNASTFFNGKIDEIALWNRVLTQNEISQLYNNGGGLNYPFI